MPPREEHSEEMDFAIWRMHQSGDDLRTIGHKLKACYLQVSRKYINLAIRRGNVIERAVNWTGNQFSEVTAEENLPGALPEPGVSGAQREDTPSSDHVPIDETTVEQNTEIFTDPPLGSDVEIAEMKYESEEDGETHAKTSDETKKHRRIKTTDDLIQRIQDDFRTFPDLKVKQRAAKFGIAVGTLCQIKHNILKMPKESGRTWKSTPQMVEHIAADMRLQPSMKVKDRAHKFGISVGTLCRIMHDILEMPKRQIQRSTEKRGSRKNGKLSMAGLNAVEREELRNSPSRKARGRNSSLMIPKEKFQSQPQVYQMLLKTDSTGQVVFIPFDPSMAAQLADGTSNNVPISVGSSHTDDLSWMVNPGHDLDHSAASALDDDNDDMNGIPASS